MSRPVDNRLNRSGHGELSQRDQKPPKGVQEELDERDLDRSGQRPDEQSPGHDHENPDSPDYVHPALKADGAEGDSDSKGSSEGSSQEGAK